MKTIHINSTYQKKQTSFFIFMMLLMLIIYGKASAQELQDPKSSSYLKLGIGYGFSSGSQLLTENSTYSATYNQYANASTSTTEGIYGTLGAGLILNAAYTHMYTKHLGMDLNIQYLMGKKYESNSRSTYNGSTTYSSSSFQSKGILFSPSLIISVGEQKIKPYVRIGGMMGILKVNEQYINSTIQSDTEYRGGISFGFQGGLGLDIAISDNVICFSEVGFTSMSFYPKEGTSKTEYNGTTQERTVKFVKEYNSHESYTTTLSDSFPMGNIALSVGLKFRLNSKNKA